MIPVNTPKESLIARCLLWAWNNYPDSRESIYRGCDLEIRTIGFSAQQGQQEVPPGDIALIRKGVLYTFTADPLARGPFKLPGNHFIFTSLDHFKTAFKAVYES